MVPREAHNLQTPVRIRHPQHKIVKLTDLSVSFTYARSKGLGHSRGYLFRSSNSQISHSIGPHSLVFVVASSSSILHLVQVHRYCNIVKPQSYQTGVKLYYARSKGLEPSTFRVTGGCSNQLSYDRILGCNTLPNFFDCVDGRN